MESVPINMYETTMPDIINNIEKLVDEFHVYARTIQYNMNSNDRNAGYYLVMGLEPIPDIINPVELVERSKRHMTMFFPHSFAIRVDRQNLLKLLGDITDYCRAAEFISGICQEYGTTVPEKIRRDELHTLIALNKDATNPTYDEYTRAIFKNEVEAFVINHFPKKETLREKHWNDYYRSEKYDSKKSRFQNLIGSRKKDEQNVDMEVLFEGSNVVKEITVSEYELKRFQEALKKHPNVVYHLGEKKVIDHGMIDGPWGKAITDEQYHDLLLDKFASQQFDAVKNVKPSHFEYRPVYYKAADERIIASVYNRILLDYARCDAIYELRGNGPISSFDLPFKDCMNFVSLAKFQHLPFSFDFDGKTSTPGFETIGVIVNRYDVERVKRILNRLAEEKFTTKHALSSEQLQKLKSKDSDIDDRIRRAEADQRTLPRNQGKNVRKPDSDLSFK